MTCSPEDHAILEAEYQKNPKPDKLARLDIVNRVALGEKEVQVNRHVRCMMRNEAECSIRYGFKIADKMTDDGHDRYYRTKSVLLLVWAQWVPAHPKR